MVRLRVPGICKAGLRYFHVSRGLGDEDLWVLALRVEEMKLD
jgi:hypothetical protein